MAENRKTSTKARAVAPKRPRTTPAKNPPPASDHKMLMAITDVSRRREAEDKFKDEVEEISRMNHLMIERELKLGGNRDEIHALKGENAQLRKNIAKDDE